MHLVQEIYFELVCLDFPFISRIPRFFLMTDLKILQYFSLDWQTNSMIFPVNNCAIFFLRPIDGFRDYFLWSTGEFHDFFPQSIDEFSNILKWLIKKFQDFFPLIDWWNLRFLVMTEWWILQLFSLQMVDKFYNISFLSMDEFLFFSAADCQILCLSSIQLTNFVYFPVNNLGHSSYEDAG